MSKADGSRSQRSAGEYGRTAFESDDTPDEDRALLTDTQVDVSAALAAIAQPTSAGASVSDPFDHPTSTARYEVLEALHRGGMGEILLAKLTTPSGFSRRVVLKGLLSRLTADSVSHALFMREAHLMARLDHPNIVRVFDLPLIDGRPFLAMELVRGRNLHQVIQRSSTHDALAGDQATGHQTGPFAGVPPLIALTVISEALRGLHSAHCLVGDQGEHLGLVHRDVSPGNILLSYYGEVKVTDFGIAKLADSPKYTGPRSIRGKARYVAPEQVQGRPATVASDIYSAGVVLAEALMGAPLWERGTVADTLMAVVTEDRDSILDSVLQDVPSVPGLRAVLRRALSTKPGERPESALRFAEILESIATKLGPRPTAVDLGLYLRDLFRGLEDVPEDDGFGVSALSGPAVAAMIGDEETTATSVQAPDAPPGSRFVTAPIAEEVAVYRAPAPRKPPSPKHGVPRSGYAYGDGRATNPSSNGQLITGIFIGASLAIAGCLLALAW